MSTIYRKTAKGSREVGTREHGLPPRVRSALILVDGRRDDEVLLTLISQDGIGVLANLLQEGFIEVAARPGPPAAAPVAAALATRTSTLKPPAQNDKSAAKDFVARRRAAVQELHQILGPSGDSLAIRMERAKDAADLRQLLVLAVRVIGGARGNDVAQTYAQHHDMPIA